MNVLKHAIAGFSIDHSTETMVSELVWTLDFDCLGPLDILGSLDVSELKEFNSRTWKSINCNVIILN